ncbi:NAD(P)-binding protein [Penicillium longicatenatum]|nr:NAD(P)-binding protein [Penicillium longicatenatum]
MVKRLEPEVKAIVDSLKTSSFDGSWFASFQSNKLGSWKLQFWLSALEGRDFGPANFTDIFEQDEKGLIIYMCNHTKPCTETFEVSERAGWKVFQGTESLIWQAVAQ